MRRRRAAGARRGDPAAALPPAGISAMGCAHLGVRTTTSAVHGRWRRSAVLCLHRALRPCLYIYIYIYTAAVFVQPRWLAAPWHWNGNGSPTHSACYRVTANLLVRRPPCLPRWADLFSLRAYLRLSLPSPSPPSPYCILYLYSGYSSLLVLVLRGSTIGVFVRCAAFMYGVYVRSACIRVCLLSARVTVLVLVLTCVYVHIIVYICIDYTYK